MRRKPVSRATRARRRPVRVSKGREDRGAARASAPGAPESARILDAAFRRAYRATPHGASRVERSRRRALLKIVRSSAVVLRQLALVGRPFQRPGLSAFESKLVDRAFGEGTLDRLSILRWAALPPQGELELASERGQRRAELVGGARERDPDAHAGDDLLPVNPDRIGHLLMNSPRHSGGVSVEVDVVQQDGELVIPKTRQSSVR